MAHFSNLTEFVPDQVSTTLEQKKITLRKISNATSNRNKKKKIKKKQQVEYI